MATLNLQVTNVYQRNWEAYNNPNIRFIVNQGGTRSSKTYSIAQLFVTLLYQLNGEVFTVVRKTLPALKYSAMKDFLDILKNAEVYSEDKHNRTELIYRQNNNELEFLAVDQPQKIRGRKRHILWCNEGNELTWEDFQQLNLRTTGKVFIDYNPSDEYHWIYDKIITRDDAVFIQSTYLDNPFLDDNTVGEIERLKKVDKNYWRIYGLGERGISETTIYKHWELCDTIPEGGDVIYGLDFGFNNPSCLVQVVVKDDEVYVHELLYRSNLTNSDLIEQLKTFNIGQSYIYCDSAEPQRIEELNRAGFTAIQSDKSVNDGIDSIKRRKLLITKSSVNILKEIKSYRWKEKDGKPIDEPVKVNDHSMDATRYAVHTSVNQPEPDIYIG